MLLSKNIVRQISDITGKLIKSSFSIKENYVASDKNEVSWSGYKNIAFTLKKQPYDTIYKQCIIEKAYNFMLLDNALIQLMYRIKDNEILSHRLAYLPHPNYLNYQENPEDFEELYYGNELFTEIIEKKVISIPLRFDYDIDEKKHIDINHPKSHVTIGNYQNCRIPASKPITPYRFILFILRSFYYDRFNEYFTNDDFKCKIDIDETISIKEKEMVFFST